MSAEVKKISNTWVVEDFENVHASTDVAFKAMRAYIQGVISKAQAGHGTTSTKVLIRDAAGLNWVYSFVRARATVVSFHIIEDHSPAPLNILSELEAIEYDNLFVKLLLEQKDEHELIVIPFAWLKGHQSYTSKTVRKLIRDSSLAMNEEALKLIDEISELDFVLQEKVRRLKNVQSTIT